MTNNNIIKANNVFSIDLYSKLKEPEKNLFFSPFSIFISLLMVLAGASGETKKKIEKTLHILYEESTYMLNIKDLIEKFKQEEVSEVYITNLLCLQEMYPPLDAFLDVIENTYKGDLWCLDFADNAGTCNKINSWVKQQTHGKIANIINEIDKDTVLLLVNAIYFKDLWDKPFKKRKTAVQPFTLISGEKISVNMMHQIDKFRLLEGSGYKVLEMPYKGKYIKENDIMERITMIIFLPEKINGLSEMEDKLTIDQFHKHLSNFLETKARRCEVFLPRFKFESSHEMSSYLCDLGMEVAFGGNANFSRIMEQPPLKISNVIHKAVIEVNEESTEAAAVTAVRMSLSAAPMDLEKPLIFRADHPFSFFLIDSQSGTILFHGRVMEPSKIKKT